MIAFDWSSLTEKWWNKKSHKIRIIFKQKKIEPYSALDVETKALGILVAYINIHIRGICSIIYVNADVDEGRIRAWCVHTNVRAFVFVAFVTRGPRKFGVLERRTLFSDFFCACAAAINNNMQSRENNRGGSTIAMQYWATATSSVRMLCRWHDLRWWRLMTEPGSDVFIFGETLSTAMFYYRVCWMCLPHIVWKGSRFGNNSTLFA